MFALLEAKSARSQTHVEWTRTVHIKPDSCSEQAVQPSVLDLLAAPTVFLEIGLLYGSDLQPQALCAAVKRAVNAYPAFAFRLTAAEEDGRLSLVHSNAAGVAFMEGKAADLTVQQLLPQQPAGPGATTTRGSTTTAAAATAAAATGLLPLVVPELPELLFGQLPGALTPHYLDSPDQALTHIALLHLQGGGCVLGLRTSHLLGDWSSLRLLLRSIAAAYSGIMQHQQQQQQEQPGQEQTTTTSSSSGSMVPAAPLLNRLVAAARQQLPAGFQPVRLKLLEPADEARFAGLGQLASSSSSNKEQDSSSCSSNAAESSRVGQPVRLTYHAVPAFIQQLKDLAAGQACGSAASKDPSSSSSSRAVTTHNVLLALVLQAFCSLPGREGLPHDVAVSVDMRSRVPAQYLEQLPQQQQGQLGQAVGNFFASAIVEDCVPVGCSLGQLAEQVAAAVQRGGELWLPDLGWASGILGLSAAALAAGCAAKRPAGSPAGEEGLEGAEEQQQGREREQEQEQEQQGQVTWRRLHAMGPRSQLQQQMALGCLASLSTTQWPLDSAREAAMAGQVPLAAVPAFSQPQPFPLLLSQQAPSAMGGGVLLHVWLDGAEVEAMQQAMAAAVQPQQL